MLAEKAVFDMMLPLVASHEPQFLLVVSRIWMPEQSNMVCVVNAIAKHTYNHDIPFARVSPVGIQGEQSTAACHIVLFMPAIVYGTSHLAVRIC